MKNLFVIVFFLTGLFCFGQDVPGEELISTSIRHLVSDSPPLGREGKRYLDSDGNWYMYKNGQWVVDNYDAPLDFYLSGNTLGLQFQKAGLLNVDLSGIVADGSETKLSGGANISVSGLGTQASPYVITGSGAGGGSGDGNDFLSSAILSGKTVTYGVNNQPNVSLNLSAFSFSTEVDAKQDILTGSESIFNGWDKDASDDFDGAYSSLIGLPTLFDGNYNSLSNLPTLFDGSWGNLTGIPSYVADGDDDNQVIQISGSGLATSLSMSKTTGNTIAIGSIMAIYDNSTSGLSATNLHAAIDELAASGGGSGAPNGIEFQDFFGATKDITASDVGTSSTKNKQINFRAVATATLQDAVETGKIIILAAKGDSLIINAPTGGEIIGEGAGITLLEGNGASSIAIQNGKSATVYKEGTNIFRVEGDYNRLTGSTALDLPGLSSKFLPESILAENENDPITTWTDMEGVANLTSAGSNRPTLHLENGQKQADFDAPSFQFMGMAAGSSNFLAANEFTIVVELGHRAPNTSNQEYIVSRAGFNETSNHQYSIHSASGNRRFAVQGNIGVSAGTYSPGDVIILSTDGSNFDVYLNGTKIIDNQSASNSATYTEGLKLGGRNDGLSANMDASIESLVIYQGTGAKFTQQNATDVTTYLQNN